MSKPRIYLDHNASSPLRPAARQAAVAAMDAFGNASSVHAEGRAARAIVEAARHAIAAAAGIDARQVVFTSGATEAANALASPALQDARGGAARLLMGASEHACLLDGHSFGEAVARVALDAQGRLDLTALDAALAASEARPMLALQSANNETGIIQPLAAASARIHAQGGLIVCDAVQSAGKSDISPLSLGADAVFISSHKLGGPKGAGAILLANPDLRLSPAYVRGGGQERGWRGGTEDVAAIAGFASAFAEAHSDCAKEAVRLGEMRDALETHIAATIEDAVFFGASADRLPNTSAFAIDGITAETLLMAMDIAGFAVSSGSACSSGKVRASHVLAAMGIEPHIARGALRVSLGWTTTPDCIAAFCETLAETVRTIRMRRKASNQV